MNLHLKYNNYKYLMKTILNPGNGITFPRKGEYIKLRMRVIDQSHNILFDSNNCDVLFFRFKMSKILIIYDDSFLTSLEEIIGTMSLFEKSLIEINNEMIKESLILQELLKCNERICYEVEILHISNIPYSV